MIYFGIVNDEGTLKAEFGPISLRGSHIATTELANIETVQYYLTSYSKALTNQQDNGIGVGGVALRIKPVDFKFREIRGGSAYQDLGVSLVALTNLKRAATAIERSLVSLEDFDTPEHPIDYSERFSREAARHSDGALILSLKTIPEELDARNNELLRKPKKLPQKMKRLGVDYSDILPDLRQ